jgi:hypothetical protein
MNRPRTQRNLDGYGAPLIEWSRVRDRLDQGITQAPDTGGPNRHTAWLATLDADGRPHVMPVGVHWIGGTFYFNSGPGTRKSQNLARDPRCTITFATHPFDVIAEGEAQRVTDPGELQRVVDTFNAGGWPASVEGDALTAEFSAPAAGPPPWYAYKVVPTTVYAMGTAEPFGATRFRF